MTVNRNGDRFLKLSTLCKGIQTLNLGQRILIRAGYLNTTHYNSDPGSFSISSPKNSCRDWFSVTLIWLVRRGHLLGSLTLSFSIRQNKSSYILQIWWVQPLNKNLLINWPIATFTHEVITSKYEIVIRIFFINSLKKIYKEKIVMIKIKSFYNSSFVLTCCTSSGHIISKLDALTRKDSDMIIDKNR